MYVKTTPSILPLKFRLGTQGLFEEHGRQVKGGRSQESPNCRTCKESIGHVLFECASYDSQFPEIRFFGLFITVLPPNAIKAFLFGNIFD